VVVISSDAKVEDPALALPPIVATLSKPLDLDQFVQTVNAIVRRGRP
jgi:hypothetical protein